MSNFQPAPTDAYEVVLADFDWANAPEGDDPHWWEVADIRLGGRSIRDDWGRYGWPHTWRRSRAQALEVGEQLVEWHRERHLWWTPLRPADPLPS